jgi:hypothetical protein
VTTKTSKVLGPGLSLPSGPWRSKAVLVAGFVGVGSLGVLLGRASNTEAPSASPATQHSASAAPQPEAEPPQHFDLTEDPRSHAGIALRPMDRDIFALINGLNLERNQMKDVFPERPYRVAFIGSLAEKRIGLVMIDLDRDGTFEERWELKRGEVDRTVPKDPAAGGNPVKYTLAHGRWQVH